MQARLLFNCVVHQYFIPGAQLGAKVSVARKTGQIERVFSVVRPISPGQNCLWCNGLIAADKLQEEALSDEERQAQRYVDEPDLPAPSVITLNAVAAAHAVNDYLMRVTGLRSEKATEDYVYFEPQDGAVRYDVPRKDPSCHECGSASGSRYGRGDASELPTRPGRR